MNEKMLVFDMDDTIVGLKSYPDWLYHLHHMSAEPYEKAEPLYQPDELNSVLNQLKQCGYRIAIVSWLTYEELMNKEYKSAIRKAKKEWLKRYNFPADEIHVIKYGANKKSAVKKFKGEKILFDDTEKVLTQWKGKKVNAGKVNVLEYLKEMLKSAQS